ELVGLVALHARVERECIGAPARAQRPHVLHERMAHAGRAPRLVGHKVVAVHFSPGEGAFHHSVDGHAQHLAALERHRHLRAGRDHLAHARHVVAREMRAKLQVHALGGREELRVGDLALLVGDGDDLHFAPSRRNISLMPRTAWRSRLSFSIRAKRTWSSPKSPKPTPGETATLASRSSFLANSIEPISRYCPGICAQMYIEALGFSTGQPASCSPFTITSRRFWYFWRISSTQSCGPSRAAMAATCSGVNVP